MIRHENIIELRVNSRILADAGLLDTRGSTICHVLAKGYVTFQPFPHDDWQEKPVKLANIISVHAMKVLEYKVDPLLVLTILKGSEIYSKTSVNSATQVAIKRTPAGGEKTPGRVQEVQEPVGTSAVRLCSKHKNGKRLANDDADDRASKRSKLSKKEVRFSDSTQVVDGSSERPKDFRASR